MRKSRIFAAALGDHSMIVEDVAIETETSRGRRPVTSGHCQLEKSEGDFRRFASAIHQVACDV